MKFQATIAVLAFAVASTFHAQAWTPLNRHIHTPWADSIDVRNVHPEYPRPNLKRPQWQNLNGLWNYSITPRTAHAPGKWEGEILVPFAVESDLSGVGRTVGPDSILWYQRTFTIPASWRGKEVKLNFGAVDWKCDVWVNDVKVGTHTGGFSPFSLNVTPALRKGDNTLRVCVWDPSEKGPQPRSKQVSRPEGIWYTPVTGIWQTVWLEPVEKHHIAALKITPDVDRNILTVEVAAPEGGSVAEVVVSDGARTVASAKALAECPVEVAMPDDVKIWSPDSPAIYELIVTLRDADGRVTDTVGSYAAMRKISTARDNDGIVRMQLNGKPLFQFGPLDQGWWPDGLYTAPTYNAMVYDLKKTKDFGFNMIRKHVKVEPATWFEFCDRNGILVWQDMPSGDSFQQWQNQQYFDGTELKRSPESEAIYRKEWREIIDNLHNYPSIVVWVPFNESWGQFKTPEITAWTKSYDPSRLVNPASGGNFFTCGDILDLHNYPAPKMFLYDAQRVNVLGEYGGIGYVVDGHIWSPERNWGYVQFKSSDEVTDEYVKYAAQLRKLADKGFSAGVYTQTTDVENEVNGLITYDRRVIKIDEERVRRANDELTGSLDR